MPSLQLESCSESIRQLAAELARPWNRSSAISKPLPTSKTAWSISPIACATNSRSNTSPNTPTVIADHARFDALR
jgi:hypothetical protein